ncbi:MAG: MarR family transcriptional regulator [Clostridia bacterium]|jgi:DNA-binding MarR family transcriptional regulator
MDNKICESDFNRNEKALLLENQLCFPLYSASRKIIRLYTPILDKLNLTYTQYITMLALWEKDGIGVKDLGSRLYLDSGTLTPLLKKLESQGLLNRIRDVSDERNVNVFLTDKGMKLKQQALNVPAMISSCIDMQINDAIELQRLLKIILND